MKDKIWEILLNNSITPDAGDPIGAVDDLFDYIQQQLQQAHRQGWEQCQRETVIVVRKYYGCSLIDANSGERVKAAKDVLLDAIASMEYKEE